MTTRQTIGTLLMASPYVAFLILIAVALGPSALLFVLVPIAAIAVFGIGFYLVLPA